MGNGAGLDIHHIGHSLFTNSNRTFVLNNLLHVPNITKNLISVSQFAQDNNVYFEFHPFYCLVKDQVSGKVLLQRTLNQGLCQFHLSKHSKIPSHNYHQLVSPQVRTNSMANNSLFMRYNRQTTLYILVYVDDIIITGGDRSEIQQLVLLLNN